MNGTPQLLIYDDDDVKIFGENINVIKKTQAVLDATKDVGLKVNAGKLSIGLCRVTRMQNKIII